MVLPGTVVQKCMPYDYYGHFAFQMGGLSPFHSYVGAAIEGLNCMETKIEAKDSKLVAWLEI